MTKGPEKRRHVRARSLKEIEIQSAEESGVLAPPIYLPPLPSRSRPPLPSALSQRNRLRKSDASGRSLRLRRRGAGVVSGEELHELGAGYGGGEVGEDCGGGAALAGGGGREGEGDRG